MEPEGVADATARIIITAIFFVWNLYEGSVFEDPYAKELVRLYVYPFWRFTLVFAVVVAALWCPRVAAMFGLAIFFYFEDMEKLKKSWLSFATE